MKRLMTSESVTEGHPDKLCDQVSDAILDAYLEKDPESRVAVEAFATKGLVVVGGEVTSKARVDIDYVARKTIKEIGYDDIKWGLDADSVGILISLHSQSPDIAQGVNHSKEREQGAGDQGMMFGFACSETKEYMPLPILLAHNLTKKLSELRKSGALPYLGPDGKSQVTVEYISGKPLRVESVVLANQHEDAVSSEKIRKDLIEKAVKPVLGKWLDPNTKLFINATGKFVMGGPSADTGLTGRKIIVDTYGSLGRHGGGAFSGKDPTKVDRSACYMARHIAKNLVAAGVAEKLEVQLAYAIGHHEPVGIFVDAFGTEKIDEEKIVEIIKLLFPLTPRKIIDYLELRKPIYRNTASYGHFGREHPDFTWEQLTKVEEIKKAVEKVN